MAKPKKKAKAKSGGFLTAKIGRVDDALTEVTFTKGQTVQSVLDKAGIDLSSGESVNDRNANEVDLGTEAKADMIYVVVGNYKNGCN